MGLFRPSSVAHAHCDLFCGVYDPAQAKIEAMSTMKAAEKYHDSDDPVFRDRALLIKEERAELVKHHLMVLWADFFTEDHAQQFPELHETFWKAIKAAGDAKKSDDPSEGKKLNDLVDQISNIFWKTDKAQKMGVYPPK